MSHSPSIPLDVEMGWSLKKTARLKRRCTNCYEILAYQDDENDYYHCSMCGHSSLEYTTDP